MAGRIFESWETQAYVITFLEYLSQVKSHSGVNYLTGGRDSDAPCEFYKQNTVLYLYLEKKKK